jgi:hypothetical protein
VQPVVPVSAGWRDDRDLAATLPGLPPRKAPGHPAQQIRQQRGPGIIRYRRSSDCRTLIVSHNRNDCGSRTFSAISSDQRQQLHGHELLLP